ncbi:hypothetical protein CH296_28365 [Rhodococcus sp. 14-2496-1d]|uniref:hypothetical protein n=1 Tax=Rhodococcus sp. 14-2496-1d TaxID=2023146 RepID=UPI000B9BEA79|nr:hypothetical protein [Rhodococcus sp. 14-2496-1d]OZF23958.1 hypothetical protein CH296_28365 [Rhodococcus sp. 14-2496-1d]
MIVPVLVLGGGRYLDVSGIVVPAEHTFTDQDVRAQQIFDPEFDPDLAAAPGSPEKFTEERRPYWSQVAASGGYVLDELIQL